MRAIAVCVALISGCAAPQGWYKAGTTAQEFEMDRGMCNAQAFGVPGAMNNMMQVAIVQNACMRGKGWVLQEIR